MFYGDGIVAYASGVVAGEDVGEVVQHFWLETFGCEPGEVKLHTMERDVYHEDVCAIHHVSAFIMDLAASAENVCGASDP